MSDAVTGVFGLLPKKVEEIPIAFWNTFGIGFFLVFSTYSYSIVSIQEAKFEIILILSIFLSLFLTLGLMLFLGFLKVVISHFLNHKKNPTMSDVYLLSAISTFGFSIVKFASTDNPPSLIWVFGAALWLPVLWMLLTD